MIEGDKTTAANLFQSQAPCNMPSRYYNNHKWQQKEILRGRSFTLSCSFFSVLLSGNSGKANYKVWQPLEDETGYKEAKMKAVDSDFDL